ncbi:GAG1At protein [Trifolium repens]|nr:GAG1At protein [Trifolium repens]
MSKEANSKTKIDATKIGGGGFRSKLDHVLYSGDKKHVFAGLVLITAVFSVPWFLMNRGSKHQSHQDYLEKADKARSQRLSSSPASAKS